MLILGGQKITYLCLKYYKSRVIFFKYQLFEVRQNVIVSKLSGKWCELKKRKNKNLLRGEPFIILWVFSESYMFAEYEDQKGGVSVP